jgi:hypothetical protein
MVSKHSAVRSIRLQIEMWAWLSAEAERRKTNVNGLVSDFVEVGRFRASVKDAERVPPAPPTWPSGAVVEPHHVEDPASKLTLGSAVTVGYQRPKPGSRAKPGKGSGK